MVQFKPIESTTKNGHQHTIFTVKKTLYLSNPSYQRRLDAHTPANFSDNNLLQSAMVASVLRRVINSGRLGKQEVVFGGAAAAVCSVTLLRSQVSVETMDQCSRPRQQRTDSSAELISYQRTFHPQQGSKVNLKKKKNEVAVTPEPFRQVAESVSHFGLCGFLVFYHYYLSCIHWSCNALNVIRKWLNSWEWRPCQRFMLI